MNQQGVTIATNTHRKHNWLVSAQDCDVTHDGFVQQCIECSTVEDLLLRDALNSGFFATGKFLITQS